MRKILSQAISIISNTLLAIILIVHISTIFDESITAQDVLLLVRDYINISDNIKIRDGTGMILILMLFVVAIRDFKSGKAIITEKTAWGLASLLLVSFFGVMLSQPFEKLFGAWLGIKQKSEILQFIGLGIAGVLALLNAVAVNRRATAQEESTKAQVTNNELIEKGRIDERFKSATENLGSQNIGTRIASFYLFYYLAKDSQDNNVRRNSFDVMCAHLRTMPNDQSHVERNGNIFPTKEYQTLLNILFKPEDESIFSEFHANLQSVNLTHTNLEKANLANADLCDAILQGANLTSANLADSKFTRANIAYAHFIDAKLERANLKEADLRHAKFIGANLKAANLESANLVHANFVRANLTDAIMTRAKMEEACLDQANIRNANLTAASLDNAYLVAARLEDANLTGTGFDHANLTNANLTNANLDHTYFANADLTNANLTSARFMISDFMNTKLRNVNFTNTDLLHTNLHSAKNIEGADFREAKMGTKPITKDDIPTDKGEYYAKWNPPPEKEEN